jgi:hypothetical protein
MIDMTNRNVLSLLPPSILVRIVRMPYIFNSLCPQKVQNEIFKTIRIDQNEKKTNCPINLPLAGFCNIPFASSLARQFHVQSPGDKIFYHKISIFYLYLKKH